MAKDEAELLNQTNKTIDSMKPFVFGIILAFSITSLPDAAKTIFPNGNLVVEAFSLFIFVAFAIYLIVEMLPKIIRKFWLETKRSKFVVLWIYKSYIMALVFGLLSVIYFYLQIVHL